MLSENTLNEFKAIRFTKNKYANEERDRLLLLLPKLEKVTDAMFSTLVVYCQCIGKLRALSDSLPSIADDDLDATINNIAKLQKTVGEAQKQIGINDLKDEKENAVLKLLGRKKSAGK